MNTENVPKSPLVPDKKTSLIDEIPVSKIIKGYKKSLDIDVSGYFTGLGTVKIYECNATGYGFYYPFDLAGKGDLYEKLRKFDWYYLPWKWEYEMAASFIKRGQSVLEIGCGEGHFLRKIQNTHNIQGVGLELNPAVSAQDDPVTIKYMPVEEYCKYHQSSFDVVCSFQVLEHVPDVKNFLEAQINCLKKDGLLIISVPNNDSFIQYDNSFILNMPPHHMGLWTEHSLHTVAGNFNLTLERKIFEPLQPYHYEYYYRTVYRKKLGHFLYKAHRLFYKLGMKRVILNEIEKKAPEIKGHTIMAVYRK